MNIRNLISSGLLLAISFTATAQMTLTQFVSGVSRVTDIRNVGDDRVFIVEQVGRIRIASLQGVLNTSPFLNIVSKVGSTGNEQGLLGLAFSPNYATDGRFYVDYTNLQGNTVIARYTVSATNPDSSSAASEEILFTITQPYTNHNGGSMQFGPDGYLYIGMGDGGSGGDPGNRAQNLTVPLGKILRIDVNGSTGYSIPASNPFVGVPNDDERIWAYGIRNPWRTSFDKVTGDFWIADVGQNLWEEIDFEPAGDAGGHNYGWRCYEGNVAYNSTGCGSASSYTFPVYVFPHNPACSVTGGYVYRGVKHAAWWGKYFFTDYCSGIIQSLDPNGAGGFTTTTYGTFSTNTYTTFGTDRYGEMYIGKNSSGVWKIADPSQCQPVAFITAQDTITACGFNYSLAAYQGQAFTYQWYLNGAAIAGADSSSYQAAQSGYYQVSVTNAQLCSDLSDSVYLNLISPPVVSLTGLPSQICADAQPVAISVSPSGGNLSGAGVNNNQFNPSVVGPGNYDVTYTYMDPVTGCSSTVSSNIIVNALPIASITGLPSQVCVYNAPTALNGSPAGGSFSGAGVNGSLFDPAAAGLGSYSLTYTYQDVNGCIDTAQATIVVDACVGMEEVDKAGMILFPNPGDAQHPATLKLNAEGLFDLQIFGSASGLVHSSKHNGKGLSSSVQIQLPVLSAGNYLVRVTEASGKVRVAKLTIR